MLKTMGDPLWEIAIPQGMRSQSTCSNLYGYWCQSLHSEFVSGDELILVVSSDKCIMIVCCFMLEIMVDHGRILQDPPPPPRGGLGNC